MKDRQVSEAAKVVALYKERPWLETYFPKTKVTQAKVQLADLKMTRRVGCLWGIFGSIIDRHVYAFNAPQIAFLDKEGELICWVSRGQKSRPGKFWTYFRDSFHRESVAEALIRLDDKANEVTFVVMNFFGEITLHRPKKGFTLLNWLAKLEEEARQSLRREEEALD